MLSAEYEHAMHLRFYCVVKTAIVYVFLSSTRDGLPTDCCVTATQEKHTAYRKSIQNMVKSEGTVDVMDGGVEHKD